MDRAVNTSQDGILECLQAFCGARDGYHCWSILCDKLARLGFERVMYVRRPVADFENVKNLAQTFILSTYGPEVERFFVENRGYLDDVTTAWAIENQGAVSWSLSRQKYLDGEMSPMEVFVHETTRRLGIVAGVTYSCPQPGGLARSGFGLCHVSGDQEVADEVWARNDIGIRAMLDLFVLAMSSMPFVPDEERLTDRERLALGLIAQGKTMVDIAQVMGVHRRSVENLLLAGRKKFVAGNTTQAAVAAALQGQI